MFRERKAPTPPAARLAITPAFQAHGFRVRVRVRVRGARVRAAKAKWVRVRVKVR